MALKQPRGFVGQGRGVSHHGQENKNLHKQAGYIDADFPSSTNFSLAVARRTIHLRSYVFSRNMPPAWMILGYSSPVAGRKVEPGDGMRVKWVPEWSAASTYGSRRTSGKQG
jgi:hypothetical protein